MWPFWILYFCKPHFIIYTICSTNSFVSKWSHEVVWWLINVLSHNFWNSSQIFVAWLVNTSTKAPTLLNTLSMNVKKTPSLLQFGNGIKFNHLCLIITKTYQLCQIVKFNGVTKFKLHQYPSPMMVNDYSWWSVDVLNDVCIWSHITHCEINYWTCNFIPCY